MSKRYDVLHSACRIVCVICLAQSSMGQAGQKGSQEGGAANQANKAVYRHLVRVQTVQTPAEMATNFYPPLRCDSEGNLYMQTDPASPAIHKLNSKGERIGLFQPTANPDRKIDFSKYFAIAQSAELYELVYSHEITRYVFVYKADGNLDSTIKLQPGFAWLPAVIAVFPSGQLLISGLEYDRDVNAAMWPITGIFAADGRLLKEIKLEDDDTLRDMAASGDARVGSPGNPHGNRAISFSQVEIGADGNAYLMRWTTPAIFYAISAGGEVVRRFKVDPGDSKYPPISRSPCSCHFSLVTRQLSTELG